MNDDYFYPTNQLRWVTKTDYQETGYDTYVREVKTLQQYWYDGRNYGEGEWRDVPAVDEK